MAETTMTVGIVGSEAELDVCLALRRIVFIEEQGVPEQEELDDLDPVCTHLLAFVGERPVGTARLRLIDGEDGRVAKAQRVAVLASARNSGVGRALMRALEQEAAREGAEAVILAAQTSAIPFYERLGYLAYGEEFMDAGIPHRWMRRALPR
jgi:predicted GNAT family N-acyltransferase